MPKKSVQQSEEKESSVDIKLKPKQQEEIKEYLKTKDAPMSVYKIAKILSGAGITNDPKETGVKGLTDSKIRLWNYMNNLTLVMFNRIQKISREQRNGKEFSVGHMLAFGQIVGKYKLEGSSKVNETFYEFVANAASRNWNEAKVKIYHEYEICDIEHDVYIDFLVSVINSQAKLKKFAEANNKEGLQFKVDGKQLYADYEVDGVVELFKPFFLALEELTSK